MGKEIRRELIIIPALVKILEHVRYAYSCRHCEQAEITVPVVSAHTPKPVARGSFAAPEAIAHIVTQKFVMGIPLCRQEQEWRRQGIMLKLAATGGGRLPGTNPQAAP